MHSFILFHLILLRVTRKVEPIPEVIRTRAKYPRPHWLQSIKGAHKKQTTIHTHILTYGHRKLQAIQTVCRVNDLQLSTEVVNSKYTLPSRVPSQITFNLQMCFLGHRITFGLQKDRRTSGKLRWRQYDPKNTIPTAKHGGGNIVVWRFFHNG